jgi:F0F1-type ATP synthase assembly protein I
MKSPDNQSNTEQDTRKFLERATERFQERASSAVPTALASYALIGAILLFALIGYGIDRWRGGTSHTFLVSGLIFGIVVGFLNLASLVWKH